jgi:hypothetical protein
LISLESHKVRARGRIGHSRWVILFPLLAFACTGARGAGIDDYFRQDAVRLPEPTVVSDMNGPTLKCRRGGATYAFLDTLAARMPLDEDEELLQTIPWLRYEDPCVRQIALTAVARKIGFDMNRLGVPGMHDPEHHYYYQIIVALKAYLDEKHVPYDPKAFDGMLVDVDANTLSFYLSGNWEQADERRRNWLDSVQVGYDMIYISRRKARGPDPNWDHTNICKVEKVRTSKQGQYLISCEWDQQLAGARLSKKVVPAQKSYVVWPVTKDVMWFNQVGFSSLKFRRVK